MKGYREIATQAEMDATIEHLNCLHDYKMKEFYVISRGYVDDRHGIDMRPHFDGRCLVQGQWPPHAVEFLFEQISNVGFVEEREIDEGLSGTVTLISSPVERREVRLTVLRCLDVTCARLFYRERPEWLGREARLGHQVLWSDAVAAKSIDVGWRQCSKCGDAWQDDTTTEASYCPRCGSLTQLYNTGQDPHE